MCLSWFLCGFLDLNFHWNLALSLSFHSVLTSAANFKSTNTSITLQWNRYANLSQIEQNVHISYSREIKKKFMTTWVNVNSRRQTRASRVSHIMHIETDTLTDSCMHKQVGIFIFICYACIYIIPFLYELVGKRKRYCDAKIHFICQLKIRPANLQPDYNYMNYINICLAFVTHTRMWLPTCKHMCICMCMRTQAYVDQV